MFLKSASVLLSAMLLSSFALSGQALAKTKAKEMERKEGVAQVSKRATTDPMITLKVWQASSTNERQAFLSGFVTMLELEKEWQGRHPVSFQHSLTKAWVLGLDGMTIMDLYNAVEMHIKNSPTDMERTVVEVLWHDLVQPKMKEIMAEESGSMKQHGMKKSAKRKNNVKTQEASPL